MALGPLRLADKSAWEQAGYDKVAKARLQELRGKGQLAVCVVSVAELVYSARNADELIRMRIDFSSLPYLDMTAAAEHHLVDIMAALALRGQHRTPVPDLMLAAIAHAHSVVVLHYDSDYERIAAITGQAHEWIIPRDSGDGSNSTA